VNSPLQSEPGLNAGKADSTREPSGTRGVGSRVGPYELLRELSCGVHANVYLARDGDTEVCVKVAHGRPESMRRLRREIGILRRLSHPGIVRLLSAFEEGAGGLPWYAMERLEAGPSAAMPAPGLQDWPARGRRSWNGDQLLDVGRLACELCGALAELHRNGLVHGDVKPGNILRRTGGTPVLIDLGSAAAFGTLGRERVEFDDKIAGTAPYMAPEQIQGELLDARTDLYALGCVLFELLSGLPPFNGSVSECFAQHLGTEPAPLEEVCLGVPPSLARIVGRLLQKSPGKRFGYADQVGVQIAESLGLDAFHAAKVGAEPPYLHRSAFLGQTEALAWVERAFLAAKEGHMRALIALGESGIGKTRFALEAALLAQQHGFRVIAGECNELSSSVSATEAMTGAPLHPFAPLIEHWADLACVNPGALEVDDVAAAACLVPFFPALRPVLEMSARGAALPQPTDDARKLRRAAARLVQAVTREGPLLLIFDDMQWADPLTLEVWKELSQSVAGPSSLVLLATARRQPFATGIEQRGTAASGSVLPETFELTGLGLADVRELVGSILALDTPDPVLVNSMYRIAEGNPLMTTELLRSAAEAGHLSRGADGDWRIRLQSSTAPATLELPLPGSLRELIQLRMRDMPDATRQVLELAAVLGREFERQLAVTLSHRIFGLPRETTMAAIQQLVNRQILSVAGERHRFIHDQLREVPYEALDANLRRKLHLFAARELDAAAAANSESMEWVNFASAGLHWSRAGDRRRASGRLELAGDAAVKASAHSQAIATYEAALAELAGIGSEDPLFSARLHESLGTVLLRSGEHARAQEAFESALSLLGENRGARCAELRIKLAISWQNRLESQRALEALRLAEVAVQALVADDVPDDLPSRIEIERAHVCYWHGDLALMEASLARVSESLVASQRHEAVARYFEALALVGFRRERYRISGGTVAAARSAVLAARASGQTQISMTSAWTLGMALLFAGEIDEACEQLRQTAKLARALGEAKQELAARAYLALAQRFLGNVELTRTLSEELLDKASQGMMGAWSALAEANLAWVMLRLGECARAEQHVTRARAFWKKMSTPYPFQWTALLPHMELQLRAADPEWLATARAIIGPELHPLPDPIADELQAALHAEMTGAPELAIELGWRSLDRAKVGGYA